MTTKKERQHYAAEERWLNLDLAVNTEEEFDDARDEFQRTAPTPKNRQFVQLMTTEIAEKGLGNRRCRQLRRLRRRN